MVDRESVGKAFVGYLWICCLSSRNSLVPLDYLQVEKQLASLTKSLRMMARDGRSD